METQTDFTEKELLGLGFKLVHDGGTVYFCLILDPDNEADSDFLSTEDLTNEEICRLDSREASSAKYKVTDPVFAGSLERHEIEFYIKNKSF